MEDYFIVIRCLKDCRDPSDCQQSGWLLLEGEKIPEIGYIDILNSRYSVPACSQTEGRRFLGSSVLGPSPRNKMPVSYLTLDYLIEK